MCSHVLSLKLPKPRDYIVITLNTGEALEFKTEAVTCPGPDLRDGRGHGGAPAAQRSV